MRNIRIMSLVTVLLVLISCSAISEHEWEPWVVEKEATCMEEGLRVSTCILCDETKSEVIKIKRHTLNESNECTTCNIYYIEDDIGTGSSLVDKLSRALSDIENNNKSNVTIKLCGGDYELSTQTLSLTKDGIKIFGSTDGRGNITTVFNVAEGTTSPAISVTGSDFSISNVAFSASDSITDEKSIIKIDGDNATVTNTSFTLPSTSSSVKAIDGSENKKLTIESSILSGGGISSKSASLNIKNSTISKETSLDIAKGIVSIEGSKINGTITTQSDVEKITIEGSTLNGESTLSSKDDIITTSVVGGTLTVKEGSLAIDGSALSGDITIESAVTSAAIENSTIDTSRGSDALKTAVDLSISGSKITKGSGLYVIPKKGEGETVKVTISSSTSDSGEEITKETIRNIASKELSEDEENVSYPWSSKGSCSVDEEEVPESLFFFTFHNNDGTEYTCSADKETEIALSTYTENRGDGYVGPEFYSDLTCTKAIEKIKLTGDNKYIITSPSGDESEHSGSIYTKWEYKVDFGSSVSTYKNEEVTFTSPATTTSNNGTITIKNPTMDHYDFVGWYTTSGEKVITPTATTDGSKTLTLSSPSTLNAAWKPKTYTVTINTGSSGQEKKDVTYNTLLNYTPTKDGYIFGGYYTDSNYQTEFDSSTQVITGNTTLYVKWLVTVTVGNETKEYARGTLLTEDDVKSEKAKCEETAKAGGYHFKGWCSDETLKTAVTFPYTLSSNLTLYPSYVVYIYVTLGDGETLQQGADKEKKIVKKVGLNKTIDDTDFFTEGITNNTFIKKTVDNNDYYFAGWYTKEGEEETKITSSTAFGKDTTIYAKWYKDNVSFFSLTFLNNDATEYTCSADKETEITLSTYTENRGDGYVGPEFYSDSTYTKRIEKIKLTGDNKYIITSPSGDESEHSGSIYTKWEYKVSFGSGVSTYEGESVTFSSSEIKTSDNGKITVKNPTMEHYDFVGWYTTSEEKVITPTSTESGSKTLALTSPSTLNAAWTPKTYKVTINTGESTTETKTVTYKNKVELGGTPEKSGYVFGGYYTDSTYNTSFDQNKEITGNITIYVKWLEAVTVTIGEKTTKYAKGTSLTENDVESEKAKCEETATAGGYHFKGWYSDETLETAVTFPYTLSSNLTLYPSYEVYISVELDNSGNSETLESHVDNLTNVVKKVDLNKTIDDTGFFTEGITDNKFIKKTVDNKDYYFAGWYTKEGDTKITSSTTFPKDTTIYAKWYRGKVTFNNSDYDFKEGDIICINAPDNKGYNIFLFNKQNDGTYKAISNIQKGSDTIRCKSISITVNKGGGSYTKDRSSGETWIYLYFTGTDLKICFGSSYLFTGKTDAAGNSYKFTGNTSTESWSLCKFNVKSMDSIEIKVLTENVSTGNTN